MSAFLIASSSWTWLVSTWFWALCIITLVWLRRHIDLNRAGRDPILTEADAPASAGPWPSLSVLVAAKDEEANIGRCAAGLLAQDYPGAQVIVINDRSTDRTAQIINDIAARDSRFTAVHVRELPSGWFGKNNAMRLGLEQATGEYLCFSDADCTYDSPKLLRAAMNFARTNQVDFLSVLPRLEASSFWELVIQPAAGGIMVFWFPPQRVNNPKSRTAYANGAFMLMSRRAYESLGGHEFAKATLNEDMHLARRAKEIGLRLHVIRGGDLYRVRMYTGFKQIWRGWSRIFYGCFGTFPRLAASVCFLSIFTLSPYLSLLAAPFVGSPGGWIAGAAAAAILAQQSIMWRFYVKSGVAPVWALAYPLGGLICLGMTLNAMTRLGGRATNWRGTNYQGGAQVTDGTTAASTSSAPRTGSGGSRPAEPLAADRA